jgi:tetratricopeptide (TPR) repeat protein
MPPKARRECPPRTTIAGAILAFVAHRTEAAALPAAGSRTRAFGLPALALLGLMGCAAAAGGAAPPGNLRPAQATHPAVDPWVQFQAGHYAAAAAQLRSAIDRCRQRRDDLCELTAAIDLGVCQRALDELPAAETTLRRALALARRPALRQYEAVAACNLASVLLALHRYRAAFDMASTAAALGARWHDEAVRADALGDVAMALIALGNAGGALAAAADAEAASRRIGDPDLRGPSMLRQTVTLAAIRRRLSDCARAAPLFGEVLAAAPGRSLGLLVVEAHLGLARCARFQGDAALEREHLRQARIVADQYEEALDATGKEYPDWRRSSPRPRASGAFRRQTLALWAAEQEARAPGAKGAPRPPGAAALTLRTIQPGPGYAFALLYESDGNSIAELRALLSVPTGTAESAAAAAMAEPLLARVRIVVGTALMLRDGPDDGATVGEELAPGTWIEIVSRSGGWMKVRTESRSGFVKEVNATAGAIRPPAAGD